MIDSEPLLIMVLQDELRMGMGMSFGHKAMIGNYEFESPDGSLMGFHDLLRAKEGGDHIVGVRFLPDLSLIPEKRDYIEIVGKNNDIYVFFNKNRKMFDWAKSGDALFSYNILVNTPELGWVLAVGLDMVEQEEIENIKSQCNWHGEKL